MPGTRRQHTRPTHGSGWPAWTHCRHKIRWGSRARRSRRRTSWWPGSGRSKGDWPRAEAAARRRYKGINPRFLSSYLREEGRAAAAVGHREAAIRAYQHYLALRYDPEPSVKPEVEQVRADLADLLGERGK